MIHEAPEPYYIYIKNKKSQYGQCYVSFGLMSRLFPGESCPLSQDPGFCTSQEAGGLQ